MRAKQGRVLQKEAADYQRKIRNWRVDLLKMQSWFLSTQDPLLLLLFCAKGGGLGTGNAGQQGGVGEDMPGLLAKGSRKREDRRKRQRGR